MILESEQPYTVLQQKRQESLSGALLSGKDNWKEKIQKI